MLLMLLWSTLRICAQKKTCGVHWKDNVLLPFLVVFSVWIQKTLHFYSQLWTSIVQPFLLIHLWWCLISKKHSEMLLGMSQKLGGHPKSPMDKNDQTFGKETVAVCFSDTHNNLWDKSGFEIPHKKWRGIKFFCALVNKMMDFFNE